MKFYPEYEQPEFSEVERFVREARICTLMTLEIENGAPRARLGLFNHHYVNRRFWLHLNRSDEQVAAIRRGASARLVFQDLLAIIPSYWVEEDYAGAATSYYRFAEFECMSRMIEDPAEMLPSLQSLLGKHQPEGGYRPLDASDPIYRSLRALTILELSIDSVRTKWKVGQNRSLEARRKVVEKLRERSGTDDFRTVDEMLHFMK